MEQFGEMICNRCGQPLSIWDDQEDFTIRRRLGYGTKYDGDTLDLRLCCTCMEQLIDACVISPMHSDMRGDDWN